MPRAGRRARPVGVVPAGAQPARSRGPTASTIQVGTQILYIGGTDGTAAQPTSTSRETVGTGNFDKWAEGPALPEPRADASVAYVAGSIYVIGGTRRRAALRPTTVFVLSPDSQTGALGEWTTADDPGADGSPQRGRGRGHARTDCCWSAAQRRRPVATTLKTLLNATGALGRVGRRADLSSRRRPTRRRSSSATSCGCTAAATRTDRSATVQRGEFGQAGGRRAAREPERGQAHPLGRQRRPRTCRRPRTNASGWGANGAIYLAGGNDGSGPKSRALLGRPDERPATCPSGSTSPSATCPRRAWRARRRSSPARTSSSSAARPPPDTVLASSVRANTAPQSPFFQLGLVGATVPGLKIEGEIGQQLGYLHAAGGRDRQLHPPDPDRRLGVRPQGAVAEAHRSGGSCDAVVATRSTGPRRPPHAISTRRQFALARLDGPRRTGSPARSHASIPPATLTTSVRPARIR